MASRSAMARSLIVAAVMLAVVHSASAADNRNFYRLTFQLQGAASDYLQVAKRNQFCTSFGAVLTTGTAPLLSDLQSCVIEKAQNTPAVTGEVTVTAAFAFATSRSGTANDIANGIVNPLNNALTSTSPPTGFVKGATQTPVAGVAPQGSFFPHYFAEVEIPVTATVTGANYATALQTAIPQSTVSCPTAIPIATGNNNPGTRVVCTLSSLRQTRGELVAAAETAVKAGLTVNNVANIQALYARETSTQSPGFKSDGAATPARTAATQFDVIVTAEIAGSSPTDLNNNNKPSLLNALQVAFGGLVPLADISAGTATGSGTTSFTIDITIKVASEADANRVLEVLKQLLGSSTGTTPNFTFTSITALTLNPPLFANVAETAFPARVSRYSIVVTNTTSAFTTAPFQFRRACESITSTLQGNASACAIVDFNRPAANGDSGTLIVDITAANTSAALAISRNVVRAVAAVPVTTFALGTVTEQFATGSAPPPGSPVVAGSVVFTTNTPTSVDQLTASQRNEFCNQLTTNGYVPQSSINCYISEADAAPGAVASTVQLTARVWWNIIDYSVDEFVTALNRARTAQAFASAGPVTTASFTTAFAAGTALATSATFIFDVDFHITADLATFDTSANRATFATAIRNIVGNNAVVSVVKTATASGLTPSTGTVVSVRVFTPTATTQAAAFAALAAQVAGTNTSIAAPTATYTLQSGGFRRVTFIPAANVSEFPAVPAPPPPPTPATRPATAPATPPPGLPPQAPVTIPQDPNRDPNSASVSLLFEFLGVNTEAGFRAVIQKIVDEVNRLTPNSILSFSVSGFSSFGKKFVVQNYRGTVTFLTSSPAAAATLNTRIATAINSGAIPDARVVSVTPASNPAVPATPAAPTAPTAPAAPVAMTSGTIDIVILGTRSSFTATDQTALTSNVGSAINGTASVVGVTETSTNARKFTMQASALRVATVVSAPTAQYPTLDSIIARLLAVRTTQNGRLGNSSVFSITAATGSSAARSGPIALTILVALLVAMLSAMAQF